MARTDSCASLVHGSCGMIRFVHDRDTLIDCFVFPQRHGPGIGATERHGNWPLQLMCHSRIRRQVARSCCVDKSARGRIVRVFRSSDEWGITLNRPGVQTPEQSLNCVGSVSFWDGRLRHQNGATRLACLHSAPRLRSRRSNLRRTEPRRRPAFWSALERRPPARRDHASGRLSASSCSGRISRRYPSRDRAVLKL